MPRLRNPPKSSAIASELYQVGSIAGVFGLKGELKLDASASGIPLFVKGAVFFARPQEHELTIASVREHKGRLLIRLVDAPDIETAQAYVGAKLLADRARVTETLDDGEILDVDLVGTQLFDPAGKFLGEVVDVEHYPSSPMLVVGTKRVLVPFVKAFLREFDREHKRMILDLPDGLFSDDGG